MAQNVAAPHPLDVRLMRVSANLLFALALLGALGFGVMAVARSNWFAIRSVRVVGDTQHNNPATLRANALPQLRGTYLTMDMAAARRTFETVPWVREAVVRRVWPHQLVVELREHQPVAYWERDEGEDHLVGALGEVFEVNLGDVEDDGFPTLRGPDGSAPQVLAMYRRLRTVVEGLGGTVERLRLSDRGSWRIELERGTVIELGRGSEDEVVQRAQRFAATVNQVIASYGTRAVEYADLRHQDGYALRLAGVSIDTLKKTGADAARAATRPPERRQNDNRQGSSQQGPGKGR